MNDITTVSSFLSAVEKTYEQWNLSNRTANIWFRGQEDAKWPLLPSINREGNHAARFEKEMVRDFMLYSRLHLDIAPTNYLEWLFVMQHYGVKTRLIDWTENPLAALFFSVSDLSHTCHGSVWLLDPWALNRLSIARRTIPVSDDQFMEKYFRNFKTGKPNPTPVFPVAIRPQRLTPRIIAQRGCFTVHGSRADPLEEVAKHGAPQVRLKKLPIRCEHKRTLLKQLYACGISAYSLFPELEGLSREITFKYSRKFMGKVAVQQSE